MLAKVRSFFRKKNVLEVDTPILSPTAPIDTHIDVMTLHFTDGKMGYLHTSPEYAMKRLLVESPADIYQLGHVFREGERGAFHNPEFTMIEWYRMGFSLNQLIKETVQLIQLFLGQITPTFLSYQELLLKYVGIDPWKTTSSELKKKAVALKLPFPSSTDSWSIDTWLHFYMSFYLEPQLKGLYAIHSFPPSQAALARIREDKGRQVADRFEIFFNGLELANGFHELADAQEQRRRLEKANQERLASGKSTLPLDEKFLEALEQGLPDCCGVAAGFDRLFLLQQKKCSLKEVFPFAWEDYTISEK